MNLRLAKKKAENPREGQFEYLGRWVDKDTFRAFVYDKHGNEKLANSHKEFETLTKSGLWFASKPEASPVERKQKNDSIRSAN